MNKYQEALEKIRVVGDDLPYKEYDECIAVLQQTVDKANKYDEKETAVKVKGIYKTALGLYVGTCPYCNELVVEGTNYCRKIGKRLEWNNE